MCAVYFHAKGRAVVRADMCIYMAVKGVVFDVTKGKGKLTIQILGNDLPGLKKEI